MTISALIKFTQAAATVPAGQTFIGVVGVPVVCENNDDSGVTGWTWQVFDVPRGVLNPDENSSLPTGNMASPPMPASVSFTPDVPGAYSVLLTVTDGTNNVTAMNTFLVADEYGMVKPAYLDVGVQLKFTDANGLNSRAWATLVERIYSVVRRLAAMAFPRREERFVGVAGNQGNQTTAFQSIGSIYFDPSQYPSGSNAGLTRTVKFEAVLEVTPGMTAQVQLYNQTDGVLVNSTTLISTSTTPERKVSASLPIGGGAANLQGSGRLYLVQLRISAGSPGPSDRATCKHSQLVLEYH